MNAPHLWLAVPIGVPAYRTPRDVGLGRLLAMPFVAQRPSWVSPTGDHPDRPTRVVPRHRLLA